MTPKERILSTVRGELADRVPFFHYWRHMQTGQAERECRNRGMGVCWVRPCYIASMPHVEVTERQEVTTGASEIVRTYHTPVGSVSLRERRDAGTEQWKALRSWRDITPWQTERLIKKPEDYDIVKFMVEDTEYKPYYFPIEQAQDWLGEDGVVIAGLPHSPMQMLLINWIGTDGGRFYIHYFRYRDKVEELYKALDESYERLYEIAAESPADIVLFGDNIDGLLVDPRLFKRYYIPVYEKCARILHDKGKVMATHMDGRLGVLKDLIAKCPQDIIEAFHPPPMGDLPIEKALSLWKDKAIWIGFPAAIYTLGPEEVKRYLIRLLKAIIPGERVAIAASTENLVSNENLKAFTFVLEKAELPLTEGKIESIKETKA